MNIKMNKYLNNLIIKSFLYSFVGFVDLSDL